VAISAKELRSRVRVERVTVSCALAEGRKGEGDFVSLTVKSAEGDFTLEEAHLIHKIVSREAVEMAYMDALAKGHMGKDALKRDLDARRKNYDTLITNLEKRSNHDSVDVPSNQVKAAVKAA